MDLTSVLLAALAAAGGNGAGCAAWPRAFTLLPHGVFFAVGVCRLFVWRGVFDLCAGVRACGFALTKRRSCGCCGEGQVRFGCRGCTSADRVCAAAADWSFALSDCATFAAFVSSPRPDCAVVCDGGCGSYAAGAGGDAAYCSRCCHAAFIAIWCCKRPLSLYAIGWAVGLLLFAGGGRFVLAVFDRPKMDGPLRALNWLCGRRSVAFGDGDWGTDWDARWRKRRRTSGRCCAAGRRFGTALGMLGLSALGVWLGYRTVLSQIDLRAFYLAVAGTVALVWLWRGPTLSLGRARFALLLIPFVLWFSAVQLGQRERVRKTAAQTGLPLSARLLHVISHVL